MIICRNSSANRQQIRSSCDLGMVSAHGEIRAVDLASIYEAK
jgi:hypothetical protein